MKKLLTVLAVALTALTAAFSVSAKTIHPLGGSFTDWSSPSSYVGDMTPEAGDDCRLDRGDNTTYTVSGSEASMAAFLNMKHIRIFFTNVTIVVDVQSACVTAALERVVQDGGDAQTRGIKYGGRLVKTGPGELVFTNTVAIGGNNVLLNCDVEVREGRISVPRAGSVVRCDGYVVISNNASFVMANKETLVSKRTGESAVYWNAVEDAYYKVKDSAAKAPLKGTSESDWMYEHVIHNILFPDTAYEFVGFVRELSGVRFVLKQRGISSERFPADEEVAEYLNRELGLKPEDRYWFGNELLSVTDVGAKGDNVLKGDDGRLYFIDPLIRLKKPALEVIEGLVGPVES